ncbi:MAG: type II toxin-antitoxin system HicB family antitoxin [Gammaproteobacteria bacterium]|nr:MAG: type II toxin-antitoxin system HicB family antitoxin [Gammaproteobacteria bacterium]
MQDYHINIFYSNEDEGYIADIPDLQHCCAFGDTPQQALQEVLEAKKIFLESAKKNYKLPLPQYKPLIYQANLREA